MTDDVKAERDAAGEVDLQSMKRYIVVALDHEGVSHILSSPGVAIPIAEGMLHEALADLRLQGTLAMLHEYEVRRNKRGPQSPIIVPGMGRS